MAQPNVAREPSMEEILASIRRIIESNDPMAARDAITGLPPVYGGDEDGGEEEIHLTVDDDMPLAYSVAPANDPAPSYHHMPSPQQQSAPSMRQAAPAMEFGGMPHQQQPAGEPPRAQNKSISLADLAARVRAAADRGEPAPRHPSAPSMAAAPVAQAPMAQAPMAQAPMNAAQQRDMPMARDMASELRGTISPSAPAMPSMATPYLQQQDEAMPRFAGSEAPAPQMYREMQPAPAMPQAPAMQQPTVQQQPMSGMQFARAQIAAVPETVSAPVAQPTTVTAPSSSTALTAAIADDVASKALMSVSAGEQVSRSFEELVAAFDGSQRRSLDEMAEEILRPMLQEWLDDNLPTLVERLVREEIERVARGPRR